MNSVIQLRTDVLASASALSSLFLVKRSLWKKTGRRRCHTWSVHGLFDRAGWDQRAAVVSKAPQMRISPMGPQL